MSMKLMVRVLEEADLTRPQQAVLLAMAENASDDGSRCFPSVDLIAWKAGYKSRNVIDIMRDLRQSGVISVVKDATARRPAEYHIHLERAPKKITFDEWQQAHGRHAKNVRRGAVSREVQNDEGCNLTSLGVQSHELGVQSHVKDARENAPEPVIEPAKEPYDPVSISAAAASEPPPADPPEPPNDELPSKPEPGKPMPRNGTAQTMLAVLYEDVLGIGPPTNYGQAVKQADRFAKAGATPDEVELIAYWLLADPWQAGKGITITTVINSRDKWRAAQNAPRAPNGSLTVHTGGKVGRDGRTDQERGYREDPGPKGWSADELARMATDLEQQEQRERERTSA